MAIAMGLHAGFLNEDDLQTDEEEVRAFTFWGAFTLDQ